ncbi:hypothetical protein HAALTHF_29590n [Vreelandella aquamarina]|nr:hypothetical protein HAALTHF_29590n [Halomonas axialensis]
MRSAYHALQVHPLNPQRRPGAKGSASRPSEATHPPSLHRHTLRQITRLINIGAFYQRHMVREQLKRYHV